MTTFQDMQQTDIMQHYHASLQISFDPLSHDNIR